MKPLKILHVTDLHFRHYGRLFYSTGKKINNGFILNGHNVLNISDRDLTSQKKNIFDIGSRKILLKTIINNIENFKPDMILFGHVDRINYEDFFNLKNKYNYLRFAQWFLDPLIENGPDFLKNKERFNLKYQFCDANFITTAVDSLNFINKEIDIFIAISHGQHRGTLKEFFTEDRVSIINRLTKKASYNIFGYKKNPVWGQNYFNELSKCSMGINISRGKPIKYYSSDRIASLLGNGLLTFIHHDYQYQDFLNKNEIITYKNISDLNKKIKYFRQNKSELKRIAKNGHRKSHIIFNNKLVSEFIVKKTLGNNFNSSIKWTNV